MLARVGTSFGIVIRRDRPRRRPSPRARERARLRAHSLTRLHISAPLHSEIERPLPPQGRVSVALTSRRRAVLRRLVRWARAVGAPWARGTEPTPGEIAEIAWRRGDRRTAQWAEGVQAAAFGDAPVDAAVEASLRASEPAWQQHAPRDADED